MASWPQEERVRFGLASIEEFYQAMLAEEAARGATDAEAADRVRERIRRWRA